ncbi:MAG: gliding motility-associated transport system ATP-binding protein [Bacteroidales bacterium]|jgi:ABC-2 type transport system ATP-binding protein|nr:gliding motility-associated transport system ATP-binding protein [Bacteroidales bacterium]MDN5328667.1 gliding motility-associated transport system ATP-binding protein [Bacteroidales bacterium]
MSIEISHLTKLYGEQKALDNVTLSIRKGEITGLLGPNGAGKSTLMKIITCFIPQTAGEVWVDGLNVRDNALEIRKKLGYLPENNPLYPEMYIREYLSFIAGIYRIKNAFSRIDEVIEITGLGPEIHKTIGKLSKGYRQRVGLAQALLNDPPVLILDEPTSGLDPNQIVEIREVIKKVGKNKTLVMSTHIMQEVEAVCDRVIIINKGKIVADDKTDNLSRYTGGARIISVEFDKKTDRRGLTGIPGVIKVQEEGNHYLLFSKGETDIRAAVFKYAVDHQLTVLSLSENQRSLEDIFREITLGR